jgi:hypothetical protein
MVIWLAALAFGAPTVSELRSAVQAYDAGAVHRLPKLSDDQLRSLTKGSCVRVLAPSDDPDGPSAATGLVLTDVPRSRLWIAAQDPHAVVDPDLTEFVVAEHGPDSATWYGYWDLPRPVRDRQWVVKSYNNHALAEASGGRAWEHVWSLVPDGLEAVRPLVGQPQARGITDEQLDHAIFTPVNKGSWAMVEVGDQVLLAYQASSVVGGAIPDWMVSKLVMMRLESVLRGVETRARQWAPSHYDAGHADVLGGDGRPVPKK